MRIEARRATNSQKPGPAGREVGIVMSGGYRRENLNNSTESGLSGWSALEPRISKIWLYRIEGQRERNLRFLSLWKPFLPLNQQMRLDRGLEADEALPHTPPGGKPPETPGPLSLECDRMSRRKFVKGSLRRQKTPPLTNVSAAPGDFLRSGKGGLMVAGIEPLSASRWSAPKSGSKLESRELYLTNTGLLIEVAEVAERNQDKNRLG
jgi:hypothetical protein